MNYQQVQEALHANRKERIELLRERTRLIRQRFHRGSSIGAISEATGLDVFEVLRIVETDRRQWTKSRVTDG